MFAHSREGAPEMFRRAVYLPTLAVIFVLFAIVMAIEPYDRHDWMLENALVLIFSILILATCRSFPLSRVSYTLLFVFLMLHEIGSHYTYALVPYDDWFRSLFGTGLNELLGFERNHFDRFVHFCYGLLLAYPIREVFIRIANVRGFWSYFLPLDLTMSTSMLYELVEWGAAEFFGGELGQAYLGTQGDVWDAHKDMALYLKLGDDLSGPSEFAAAVMDEYDDALDRGLGELMVSRLLDPDLQD